MPIRVLRGNGPRVKEFGIHNGTTGTLKGWELDEADVETDQRNSQCVLKGLPKKLFIEGDKSLCKPYPGLPQNWFPLSPVISQWLLDTEENIEISRKGFPIMPNLCMIIGGATGRTLTSSIADLGSFYDKATYTKAMKSYISLSQVTCAEDVLIAQTFSPALFRLGPQPWPTLLLETLRNNEDAVFLQEKMQQRSKFCSDCAAFERP